MANIHVKLTENVVTGGSAAIVNAKQTWTPTRILQLSAETVLPEPFVKDYPTGEATLPNVRETNDDGWAWRVDTEIDDEIYTEWVLVDTGDTEYSLLTRVSPRTLEPEGTVNAWHAWVAARVAEEATLRFNADLVNANAIAEEVSDRSAADTNLQNQINAIEAGNVDTVNGETGTVVASLVESVDDPGFMELEVTGS